MDVRTVIFLRRILGICSAPQALEGGVRWCEEACVLETMTKSLQDLDR